MEAVNYFRTRSKGQYHVAGTGKSLMAWAVKDAEEVTVQEFTDIIQALRSANRMNLEHKPANPSIMELVDQVSERVAK